MAVAMAALAASFSSLTVTKHSSNSHNKSFLTKHSSNSHNKSFLGNSLNTESVKTQGNSSSVCLKAVPAITMSAMTAPSGLDKEELVKYVKSRLPGGFAAQKLIGTGRRKTAVARVVLLEGSGRIIINYRTAQEYLQGNPLWLQYLRFPLSTLGYETKYDVFVKAEGGGLSGQAQAILLGIARALCKANPENRDPLKKQGLLTRDSRCVERKKFGLHKARKAPQYSKR